MRTLTCLLGFLLASLLVVPVFGLSASLLQGKVVVRWTGPNGENLRVDLDTSPTVRHYYGQVDVFSKHSTYNLSHSHLHIARTITLQNRESADLLTDCSNLEVLQNGSAMFQCRWNYHTTSDVRADWNGEIWVTIYDRLPYVFYGFSFEAQDTMGEEKNSEWILQIEARDGAFEEDGLLEAASFGARNNYVYQCDPTTGVGQLLAVYGSATGDGTSLQNWTELEAESRYARAYKTKDHLSPTGQRVCGTAIYQFLSHFSSAAYASTRQFLIQPGRDLTLNSSICTAGRWIGWHPLEAAYLVEARQDLVTIHLDGDDATCYQPTILVSNIDCSQTIDVLNGSEKLQEGIHYSIHRDPSNSRCYVWIYRLGGAPQSITIKKEIDVTPPTIELERRSLLTVWNHTDITLSARITDISGVREVSLWHNATGSLRRYSAGIRNQSGRYSYKIESGNYSLGQTVMWFFEATDASPRANAGNGSAQFFKIPEYCPLEIGAIYLCRPDGLSLHQDFRHENYQQKFRNMLRGQGYPFRFYSSRNLSLDKLARHRVLLVASQMIQDSAWDYRQYVEENESVSQVLKEYIDNGCGDIVLLNPACLPLLQDYLGIRGDWFEVYGYNQGLSASRVNVSVVTQVPGVTPTRGTTISQSDASVGTDNHLGEGWFLLNTTTGSWGNPTIYVNISLHLLDKTYWLPLGFWKVGRTNVWLALPKWTTRGLDLIGEPHDGKTGWLFKMVEYALGRSAKGLIPKIMPFMTRHGGVAYALNGLRAYMPREEQEAWIQTLGEIERIRKITGTPVSLYLGAIPLYSPLRPSITRQGQYFWYDECYNDTGIEHDPRLVTGLSEDYAKWFTGGDLEYNAEHMNWIINGTRKFIMVYGIRGKWPDRFKIDTDGDLDFSEEKEYRMYRDDWMWLNISGTVVNVTVRGITWESGENVPWTLLVMDDISHQVDNRLFDYINSRDWIRVGIHYPWMGVKTRGFHWGRDIDSPSMWPEDRCYELSRMYFEEALQALSMTIDRDQIEPAFSPSEHTIGSEYLSGFRDAGMLVHLSNWQALFGPEIYRTENTSQWYYNMYRGQESSFGPNNWMAIANMSGITARNLGIDIDAGGTSYFDTADDDLIWMDEHGWLEDYSPHSVEVCSILDALRFWNSTMHILNGGTFAASDATSMTIAFNMTEDAANLTWVLPRFNRRGLELSSVTVNGHNVLPDHSSAEAVFVTVRQTAGRCIIEASYAQPSTRVPPTVIAEKLVEIPENSSASITWSILSSEDPMGRCEVFLGKRHLHKAIWRNGTQIRLLVSGLKAGSYNCTIVAWSPWGPRAMASTLVVVRAEDPACTLFGAPLICAILLASVRTTLARRTRA